jgi:hypothetical protein
MSIWLDGYFWSHYFRQRFIPQINAFCDVIINRINPTFANIEQEADGVAQAEFERLGHMPAEDDNIWDMSDIAEKAQEAGLNHYQAITNVHQGIINLSVAALYHLFEQQLLLFHRRQVLHTSEENVITLINLEEFKGRLSEGGLDLENLSSWPRINELRLVANSVKHAEGKSTERLRKLRPDLFENPILKDEASNWLASSPDIYMPLGGEDIYLTIDDLDLYRSSLLSFWNEFGSAICEHSDEHRRR